MICFLKNYFSFCFSVYNFLFLLQLQYYILSACVRFNLLFFNFLMKKLRLLIIDLSSLLLCPLKAIILLLNEF